jgi:NAD(P)-dependent dehydrogenase (short-subunit alcohol dehydrogenase family)
MTIRHWLITGAGSGFGLAVATSALERGDRVAATDRGWSGPGSGPGSGGSLEALRSEYGCQLWVAALDVTDGPAIRQVVAEAFGHLGHIDVVVSCAGFGVLGAVEEQSDDLVRRQVDVNLVGSIDVARAVIPWLRQQGGGRFIQMSSSGGQVPDPGMSVYNAAKFGVEGFFESAAIEWAPFGIDVTLVEPGGSRTDFNRKIVMADPHPAYADGIVGQIRGMLAGGGDPDVLRHAVAGDPAKIARAIVDSVDTTPAPRRLTLGAHAYQAVAAALRGRLAALEEQRDLAYSTDADDVIGDR